MSSPRQGVYSLVRSSTISRGFGCWSSNDMVCVSAPEPVRTPSSHQRKKKTYRIQRMSRSSHLSVTYSIRQDLAPLSATSTEQMSPHSKRMKVDADDVLPTPKRSTLASQQRQYRKLTTPFRSPVLTTPVERSRKIECSSAKSESTGRPTSATISSTSKQHLSSPPSRRQLVRSKKGTETRTERAAAQFKSPIIQSGGPSSGVLSRPSIRLTPTVQMLEHRLQALRRAVKVKEDKDEEVLQQLMTRWTDAGREAAYELWGLVKDTGDLQGKSSDLGSCWGRGTTLSGDKNWGWDKPEDDANDHAIWRCTEGNATACEEDEARNTLGTMLRRLRIDPATLGWDERMETFID
ncbi:hypothetical protein F5141DRAFT_130063 [Pisolithus sp. B1]|nr:hypothetical protein F5141DRAFT_130063 [Pisolithus sp. B1]